MFVQVAHLGPDAARGILRALLAAQGYDWTKLRQRVLKKKLTPQRSALSPTPCVCAQALHLAQLQANLDRQELQTLRRRVLALHSSLLPAAALLPASTSTAAFKTT